MICPPHPSSPVVGNWLDRHRHAGSFLLHLLGIPPTVLGIVLIPVYLVLPSMPVFLLALVAFCGGYQLQFLGHMWDGTESGEMAYLKRQWARRPWGLALPGRRIGGESLG